MLRVDYGPMSTSASIEIASGLLREVLGQPAGECTPDEVDECVRALHQLSKLVHAAQLRFIQAAQQQGLAERAGSRNVTSWLQRSLNISGGEAAARVKLAEAAADPDDGPLAQALRSGALGAEHARVITRALAGLPVRLSEAQRCEAESWLIEQAEALDPHELRQAAKRLRYQVDPTGMACEEDALKDRRELFISPQPDGMDLISLRCEPEMTAKFCTVIEPLAKPRPIDNGVLDPRSAARRRADAMDLVLDQCLAGDMVPSTGGVAQRMMVSIPYGSLAERASRCPGVEPGTLLATGEPISAAACRRIACDSGILPIVLGGDSVPLDVGRELRTAPPHIRAALLQRDGRCAFPGCDHPPGTSHAHHCHHWLDGGVTSLDNMTMLCAAHHRLLHGQGWEARINSDGRPEFVPPPEVDPQQRPRPGGRPPPPDIPELLLAG